MAKSSKSHDILVTPDGVVTRVTPSDGVSYKLNELYGMLNCDMVEVVYPMVVAGDIIAICDEEGSFASDAKINYEASRALGQTVFGSVLFCDSKRFQ